MPHRHYFLALLLCLASSVMTPAAGPEKPSPEENILQKAGVPTDADGLLAFFRGRTLTDAEQKRIGDLIRRLGGDDFDDREAAAKEVRNFGPRARPLLQAAARDSDLEIARRAHRLLDEVKAYPCEPIMAAARLLANRAPADAVPILLAYVPFADNDAEKEQLRGTLLALNPEGGADPALVAALDDGLPAKRAAAAYVLGHKGNEAQKAAARKRLGDADAAVRWQAAAGLLAAHDRAAIPTLVELTADGPFDLAWRADDALRQLAADTGPDVWLEDSAMARRKCRDAWAAWWKDKGAGVDLGKYTEPERLLGYTLGVEYNTQRVWECDMDGAIRWEIRDLEGPMDAQVLPNGHVLIAEANAHRITERDLQGTVLWEKKLDGEPNGCRRLANGNTFVSTCSNKHAAQWARAQEFASDGALIYSVRLESGGGVPNTACKARDGCIYYLGDSTLGARDTAGKYRFSPDGKSRTVALPTVGSMYVSLQELPGRRWLVVDLRRGRLLDVTGSGEPCPPADLTEQERASFTSDNFEGGRIVWQADMPGACGATRLPNGHTLVAANHKVVELGADGSVVWRIEAEGYVRRVYRR